jgi:hypothetical protein
METNNREVSEFKKAADVLLESLAAGTQQVQQVLEDKAVAVDEMIEQSRKEDAAMRAAASAAVADAVEQKKNEIFDRIEQVKDKAPYGSPEAPDMTVTKEVEALLGEIQEQRAENKPKDEADEYARIYADIMKDLKKEVESMTRIEKESKQRIVEDPGPLSPKVDEILPQTE